MAQYNRYVRVPHGSYSQWRTATLGNGYNVDYNAGGGWGNQCWDYCALCYWQYGLTLVTKAGGGTAYDCWAVSRWVNSKPPFISVTGVTNIKRGDIIITKNPRSRTGHICFADENYRTSGNKKRLWCVGQNQRGNSSLPVTRDEIDITYFVGIFRNTMWQGPEPHPEPTPTPTPTPSVVYNKGKYNFVLFNRRKRQGNG
jgi:hypothetical protein